MTSRRNPSVNTNLKSRRRASRKISVYPRRRQRVRTRTRRSNRPRPTRDLVLIFLNAIMRRRSSRRTRRYGKGITRSTPNRQNIINRPLILQRRTRRSTRNEGNMRNGNRILLTLSLMTLTPSMVRRCVRRNRNRENSPLTRTRERDMTLRTNNTRYRNAKRRVGKIAYTRRRNRRTRRTRLNTDLTTTSRTSTRNRRNSRVRSIGGNLGSYSRGGITPLQLIYFTTLSQSNRQLPTKLRHYSIRTTINKVLKRVSHDGRCRQYSLLTMGGSRGAIKYFCASWVILQVVSGATIKSGSYYAATRDVERGEVPTGF